MKKNFSTGGLAVAALAALALVAAPGLLHAQGGPCGHGPHHGMGFGMGYGPMFDRVLERLDLSDAQREQIQALFEQHHDDAASLLQEAHDARRALGEAIHAETFDEAAIRQASADVAAAEAEMAVARGLLFQKVNQILTPDQRQEMREIIKDFHAMRDDFRSRRPGWGRRGGPDQ